MDVNTIGRARDDLPLIDTYRVVDTDPIGSGPFAESGILSFGPAPTTCESLETLANLEQINTEENRAESGYSLSKEVGSGSASLLFRHDT